MTSQFTMTDDSSRPQSVHIEWAMQTELDDTTGPPDEHNEGFWPSVDPNAPGYVEPERFAGAQAFAGDRMRRWRAGEWDYVGVRAVATIYVPQGGASFAVYQLESPGIWGVESDCHDYIAELYEQEKQQLESDIRAIAKAFSD